MRRAASPPAISTATARWNLALVNTGRKSIAVLMNENREGFIQRFEIVLGGGPFEVVTGDVDSDRVLDLVVANADLNTIDIVRGRVSGGFEAPEHLAAAGFPRGVALRDLDRDGDQDMVYTQYDLDRVQILHGDGAGHFTVRVAAMATGPRPQGVVIAELMGCCLFDIAVANTGARSLTVLRQDTTTTFTRVDVGSPVALNVLTTADFDKNGGLDVAGVSSASNTMVVFRDTGSGFAAYSSYPTGSSPRGLEAVDLDRDGWLDVAVANRTSNTVGVYMGRSAAPGWFAPPVALAAGNGSREVASLDFNFDGHVDLATANEYGDSASVFTNVVAPSAGPFFEARSLGPGNSPAVHAANFNGNETPDLLGSYGVLLDGVTLVPLHSGGAAPRSVMTAAAGDFNADGRMDAAIVVAYNDGTYPQPIRVELYYGNGIGGFQYAGAFGSFGWVSSFEAGDVNRDGRTDLVAGSLSSSGPQSRLDVFLASDGGFTFTPGPTLTGQPLSVAVADLDRNGTLDLAMALGYGGNFIQLFDGDGQGGFAGGELLTASHAMYSVRAADVNRDAVPDIVAGGDGPITVWLGSSTGSYAPPQYYATGSYSFYFVIADLTDDGNPDIVTDEGALLRGAANGTFSAPGVVNIVFDAAAPVDYDRDGRLDLVVVNDSHTMVLLTRPARGSNVAPVAIAGPDYTIPYEAQFPDEPDCGGPGPSYDPNLDALTFEWRDASGRIVATGEVLCTTPLPSGTYTFSLVVRDGRGGESSDSKTITITPFKESVAVMQYSGDPHGGWRGVTDGTAAAGFRVWHPDAGVAKLTSALANPANYVDTWMLVDPTQTYKLWVRLKAQNDSWGNDSIFVQFGGGAVSGSTTRYATGTTDALDVNLEECSGCGVSGWGWRDERWGSTLKAAPVSLRFPAGGWQHVRIQTREDGVSIDQLVLSSEQYVNAPPGPAKMDATILQPKLW